MGKGGEHEVRTGTLDFMAVEVEEQKYLFVSDFLERPAFFYHNSLHELESVWWLTTWILFFYCPSEQVPANLNGQIRALNALLPRRPNSNRSVTFRDRRGFTEFTDNLQGELRHLGNDVEELRRGLIKAYIDFEVNLVGDNARPYFEKFPHNSLNNIHEAFKSKFKEIWTARKDNNIKLVRLHNVKRDRSEDNEEARPAKRGRIPKEWWNGTNVFKKLGT
ncbi:hypothetical protein AX15_004383 [Amanita polypyramis BW_CC]|nr:hypothetical protein AX15_004383 [Amanita polypyramis BW_CC]